MGGMCARNRIVVVAGITCILSTIPSYSMCPHPLVETVAALCVLNETSIGMSYCVAHAHCYNYGLIYGRPLFIPGLDAPLLLRTSGRLWKGDLSVAMDGVLVTMETLQLQFPWMIFKLQLRVMS